MLFDLSNPAHRQQAQDRFDKLLREETVIELTKKAQRSIQQNKYLHLVLTWFAMETGYSTEYVKQRFFKRDVNPELFIKKVSGKLGEVRELRSSADLSTEEMTQAIERFRNWSAATVGVHLPSPDEKDFLKHIEIEASRYYYK